MTTESSPSDAALDGFRRAPFWMTDVLRRAQGEVFGALGLGPNECPYQVIASGPFWRLRDYDGHGTARFLLIIATPIKRPYI